MARSSAASLPDDRGGVFPGATSMNQDAESKSLSPISLSGGTSGQHLDALRHRQADRRSLPAWIIGSAIGIGLNIIGIWPPATSLIAGCMPL